MPAEPSSGQPPDKSLQNRSNYKKPLVKSLQHTHKQPIGLCSPSNPLQLSLRHTLPHGRKGRSPRDDPTSPFLRVESPEELLFRERTPACRFHLGRGRVLGQWDKVDGVARVQGLHEINLLFAQGAGAVPPNDQLLLCGCCDARYISCEVDVSALYASDTAKR